MESITKCKYKCFYLFPLQSFKFIKKYLFSDYTMMRITWGGKKQLNLPHSKCKSSAKLIQFQSNLCLLLRKSF